MEIISETGLSGSDEVIAKTIGDTLYSKYPGFMWFIQMDPNHNVIIRLGDALQEGWCFFINRGDIPHGSPERLKKMAMTAGGEMLERLNIQRKGKEDGQEINRTFEGSESKLNLTAAGLQKFKKHDKIILPGK